MSNPSVNIIITAHQCAKTGSYMELYELYSNRMLAFVDELINDFGVNPERITSTYNGPNNYLDWDMDFPGVLICTFE